MSNINECMEERQDQMAAPLRQDGALLLLPGQGEAVKVVILLLAARRQPGVWKLLMENVGLRWKSGLSLNWFLRSAKTIWTVPDPKTR